MSACELRGMLGASGIGVCFVVRIVGEDHRKRICFGQRITPD